MRLADRFNRHNALGWSWWGTWILIRVGEANNNNSNQKSLRLFIYGIISPLVGSGQCNVGKLVFPWTFLVRTFLIWGCSPKINLLTAGRIDESTEEHSHVDFLKLKLNHLLKCRAYCFAVPSDQDFIIRSRTPLYKLNCLPKLFVTADTPSISAPWKRCLRTS